MLSHDALLMTSAQTRVTGFGAKEFHCAKLSETGVISSFQIQQAVQSD